MDFNEDSSTNDEGRVPGMVDQWRRREELLSEAVTKEAQLKKKARSKLIPFRKKSVQGIDLREVDDEIRDKTA